VLYAAEIHATRYQYGLALTPEDLEDKQRALLTLDALVNLHDVAGNHGRFLYDFAPDAVAFRWTDDFAPRMLYAFDQESDGTLAAPELVRRVQAGDIDPAELVVGGSLSGTASGQALAAQGATVLPGVKGAFNEVRRRLSTDLGLAL
jgi:CRISPR-associated protein Cst2